MMAQVIIALGSNIEPVKHIEAALQLIEAQFNLLATSRFIETEPIGNKNQAAFLNGAVLISSEVDELELKNSLNKIEARLGRDRTQPKTGPRTIDLDIIAWDENITDPDVYERDFLKQAILELRPEFHEKF